jgi:hypothetical protein
VSKGILKPLNPESTAKVRKTKIKNKNKTPKKSEIVRIE